MKPRDDIADIRRRLTDGYKRTLRTRNAINQWKPNDRPYKLIKSHLANALDYLTEIEREMQELQREGS